MPSILDASGAKPAPQICGSLDPINFHPLGSDRTTTISASDLIRFLRGIEHEPTVMKLPEKGE